MRGRLITKENISETDYYYIAIYYIYYCAVANQKIITHRCDHKSYLSYYKIH